MFINLISLISEFFGPIFRVTISIASQSHLSFIIMVFRLTAMTIKCPLV